MATKKEVEEFGITGISDGEIRHDEHLINATNTPSDWKKKESTKYFILILCIIHFISFYFILFIFLRLIS